MCVQKFDSSGEPIRTLTSKKFYSHMIKNNTDSFLICFVRPSMTYLSASSNLVNFAPIQKIDSHIVPIGILTKIKFIQSVRIMSWDVSSYLFFFKFERPNMTRPETELFFLCKKKLNRAMLTYDFRHKKKIFGHIVENIMESP